MTASREEWMFFVGQSFPSLAWHVIPVPISQGVAMRERGAKHVYDSSSQAYAVAQSLEVKRTGATPSDPDAKLQVVIEGVFPASRAEEAIAVLRSLGWSVLAETSSEDVKPEEPVPVCRGCDHTHSEEPDWHKRWRRCRRCGCEDGGEGAIQ